MWTINRTFHSIVLTILTLRYAVTSISQNNYINTKYSIQTITNTHKPLSCYISTSSFPFHLNSPLSNSHVILHLIHYCISCMFKSRMLDKYSTSLVHISITMSYPNLIHKALQIMLYDTPI